MVTHPGTNRVRRSANYVDRGQRIATKPTALALWPMALALMVEVLSLRICPWLHRWKAAVVQDRLCDIMCCVVGTVQIFCTL